jgi:hypothetical protein
LLLHFLRQLGRHKGCVLWFQIIHLVNPPSICTGDIPANHRGGCTGAGCALLRETAVQRPDLLLTQRQALLEAVQLLLG